MHDEMAKYARDLNEAEKKKFENELQDFVLKGNVELEFDPSDVEDENEIEEV